LDQPDCCARRFRTAALPCW